MYTFPGVLITFFFLKHQNYLTGCNFFFELIIILIVKGTKSDIISKKKLNYFSINYESLL